MPDTQLLQMALIGYEAERQKIQERIAAAPVAATPAKRGRRPNECRLR